MTLTNAVSPDSASRPQDIHDGDMNVSTIEHVARGKYLSSKSFCPGEPYISSGSNDESIIELQYSRLQMYTIHDSNT